MNRTFLFTLLLFISLQLAAYYFITKIYLVANGNTAGLTPMSNGSLEGMLLFACLYLINLTLCLLLLKWHKSSLTLHFIAISWAILLLQGIFLIL